MGDHEDIGEIIPGDAVGRVEDILKYLEITPEKLEEIKLEQERLKKLSNSRARLSRDEQMKARGAELEAHYLQTGSRAGLAEALAMQGRYAAAAQIAAREDLRRQYTEYAEAVEGDDRMCGCDPFRTESSLRLPNQSDEFRGFSEKHGRTVSFIRCHKCGKLNARAPLPHLEALRQIRNEAAKSRREKSAAEVFGKVR